MKASRKAFVFTKMQTVISMKASLKTENAPARDALFGQTAIFTRDTTLKASVKDKVNTHTPTATAMKVSGSQAFLTGKAL